MKRISLFLSIVALAICAQAQLLWKVTGNGATKPSYLFGTHHIAPVSILDSTKGFNEALAGADRVYGEIDMAVMTDPSTQMKMAQLMMAPSDSTLCKVVPAETLAKIDELLAECQVPATTSMLEPLKPGGVALTISALLGKKAFPDYDATQQLDQTVQKMAHERNIPVMGLETLDDQLNVLLGSSIAEQAESLVKTMADTEKAIESTHLLADAYLAGNLAELEKLMRDPATGMDEDAAEKLITNRNNAWIEILVGVIPTASVLVVVGAGHLPGDTGLINQLRKAGYTVEPVK